MRVNLWLLFFGRRFSFEHPEHAVSDNESADDISRGTDDRDKAKHCAYGVVIRPCRHDRTNEGDAGDRISRGHERGMQEWRHSRYHQVTKKSSERKDVESSN